MCKESNAIHKNEAKQEKMWYNRKKTGGQRMRMDTHVHITPEEISRQALKIGEKEPYFDLAKMCSELAPYCTAEEKKQIEQMR